MASMTPIEAVIHRHAERVLTKILSADAAKKVADEIAADAAPEVVSEITSRLSAQAGRQRTIKVAPREVRPEIAVADE